MNDQQQIRDTIEIFVKVSPVFLVKAINQPKFSNSKQREIMDELAKQFLLVRILIRFIKYL
jgi:hypothetical protein